MKRTIAILVLMVLPLLAEQDWARSYGEACVQAAKEKKSVLVMISRENCDACWYMENIVFEDENVASLIKKHFVPVYLDVDVDEIPESFTYIGTPTFYFTKASGEKIGHRINGASNVKDFTQKVNGILLELK